jgi:molybdate transport system substrate-binding protein
MPAWCGARKPDKVVTAMLKLLSGGAMRPLLVEAVPQFERAVPAKVDVRFALTSTLQKEIEAGAAFDLALLPRRELDALAARGWVVPGTDIARSAVGLCVRAGAAKPNIATVAAFKRALAAARSLGYSDGPSGAYVAELLVRLDLAEAMKSKVKLTSGPVAELVARGEAEIGIQQIVAILPVKGVDLVGALPAELQNTIVYAAGLSARAANADAARALIAYLKTEEAARIIRAKGLEPG